MKLQQAAPHHEHCDGRSQLTYPSWDPPIVLTPRPNTAVVQKIASTSHSWCRPQSCITTDPLSRLTLLSLFFLYSKQISPQSLPIKHPKQLYLFTASSLTGTSKSNTNNMSDNNTNYAQPNTSSNNDTNNGQPSANGGQEKPHPSSVLPMYTCQKSPSRLPRLDRTTSTAVGMTAPTDQWMQQM